MHLSWHRIPSAASRRGSQQLICCALLFLTTMTYANSVRIQGRGSPTVILVGGLGDTLHTWDRVQSAIAECTRTMAYDRAGYSGSRPPVAPRDAEHIVHELRNELRRRGIGPPYVLVGHSLGGLYMQYFARQPAADVEGL